MFFLYIKRWVGAVALPNLTAIWQILREEIADRDKEKTVLKREKRDKDTQLLNLQLEYFAEERKSQMFHAKYLSDMTEKGSSAINKALMKTYHPSQQRVMASKTTTRQSQCEAFFKFF